MDTVYLDENDDTLVIIDQELLPERLERIKLSGADEIWEAIYRLKVRGAPAIGVAAAIGLYVCAKRFDEGDAKSFIGRLSETADYFVSSRPTAVNLSWAVRRMQARLDEAAEHTEDIGDMLLALKQEALSIYDEDIDVCRRIGEYGLPLIKDNAKILTHCNAGALATVRYGTATAPMYLAHERGNDIHVFCDETRPLLQGARLTAFELSRAGIDATVLCDNMSGSLMRSGNVDIVFVGCDRVAANGDVANKIGTSMVAAMAKQYRIPFYVCAPTSTVDMDTPTGDDIAIEQRKPEEVTDMWYKRSMTPRGVGVYNPAFDVTDAGFITGIITERGIVRAPYDKGLREIMEKR